MIEWAREQQRLLQGIRLARQRGDPDTLASTATAYFDSAEVKARQLQLLHFRGFPAPNRLLHFASQLDLGEMPRRHRNGRYRYIPQPDRADRVGVSLGRFMRLGQKMVGQVIHSAFVPSAHIADWPGRGPLYHWNRVLEQLRPGAFVLVVDVRDCFQSFNPDYLYTIPFLPSGLVEGCLDYRRIRLRGPRHCPIGAHGLAVPRGLLTGGSASNALWSFTIDDLPTAVPAGAWANTCADNVIIVCSTEAEARKALSGLTAYFEAHPAGPFSLRTTFLGALEGCDFDHLGYTIDERNGALEMWPLPKNLIAMNERAAQSAADAFGHSHPDAVRNRSEFVAIEMGRCLNSFPFMCAAARQVMEDHIETEWETAQRFRASSHKPPGELIISVPELFSAPVIADPLPKKDGNQ